MNSHEISFQQRLFRILLEIVPISVIVIEILLYKDHNITIRILPDEFGYWTAGNFFAGKDNWQDLTSRMNYYGYGYAIFLAPLLKFLNDGVLCYRLAIWINGVLIYGIYLTIRKLLSNQCKKSYVFNWAVGLCFCLMSANIYYLQYTLVEVFIAFSYWRMVYHAEETIRKKRILDIVYILIYDFILMSLHQRSVGIVFCTIVLIIYIAIKERMSYRRLALIVLFSIILCIAFILIKDIYKTNRVNADLFVKVADKSVNSSNNANELGGVIQKVLFTFTDKGLVNLIVMYVGHLFYAFVSSFLLVLVGMVEFAIRIKECFKNKQNNNDFIIDNAIFLFTLACFLAEVGVGCIFFIYDYNLKFDTLTYSRYFEFTVAPIALFSLLEWMDIRDNKKQKIIFAVSLVLFLLIGKITNVLENYQNPVTGNVFIQCYLIRFYQLKGNYRPGFFVIAIVVVCISFFVITLLKAKGKLGIAIACMMMSIFYIYAANTVYSNVYQDWMKAEANELRNISVLIHSNGWENKVKTLDFSDHLWLYQLQLVLKDESIKVIKEEEELGKDEVLILSTSQNYKEMLDFELYDTEYLGNYFIALSLK